MGKQTHRHTAKSRVFEILMARGTGALVGEYRETHTPVSIIFFHSWELRDGHWKTEQLLWHVADGHWNTEQLLGHATV